MRLKNFTIREFNNQKKRELFATIIIPLIIYIFRSYIASVRGYLFCVFGPFLFIASLVVIIRLLFYISKRRFWASIIPISLIALFIPVFRIEEIQLIFHKREYLQAVEMAKENKLIHSDTCTFGYTLPQEYSKLTFTEAKCIYVNPPPNFSVTFDSIQARHRLVYAESVEDLERNQFCYGTESYGYEKLAKDWYLCLTEWN